jgi:hypothetical protein
MDPLTAPYFPIIYVRGYAMTANEIADTVATPYMGFNLGSTKLRRPGTAPCDAMCSSPRWCG